MTTTAQTATSTVVPMQPADIGEQKVLRTISGYCAEWGAYMPSGLYGNDFTKQFTFLRGAFDAAIASGKNICLTQDLDGKTIFARTDDGTLHLESDAVGLLVTAQLLDSPQNRELVRLIDRQRIRGWSHRSYPLFGGFRVRTASGTVFTHHHTAGLSEITLVVRKVPRQKVRKTPIFLTGGPQEKVSAHVRTLPPPSVRPGRIALLLSGGTGLLQSSTRRRADSRNRRD